MDAADLDRLRRIPDPVGRAQAATELLAEQQRLVVELARLRREALAELRAQGHSFGRLGELMGLSRGRIAQIGQSGPPVERGFFGLGPITLLVPLRAGAEGARPVIAQEGFEAMRRLTKLLEDLEFEVDVEAVTREEVWQPTPDMIAFCGPRQSPIIQEAIERDPWLDFRPDEQGRWVITERRTGVSYMSPLDVDAGGDPDGSYFAKLRTDFSGRDLAYFARKTCGSDGSSYLVISGIRSMGSLGVIHFLSTQLEDFYRLVEKKVFSTIIESTFDGLRPTSSRIVSGPWSN